MSARLDPAVWSGVEQRLAEVEQFIPEAPPWTRDADLVVAPRIRPGSAFGRPAAGLPSRRRQLVLILTLVAMLVVILGAALLVGAPRESVDRREEPFGPWGIYRSSDSGTSATVLLDGRVLIASGAWTQMGQVVDPTIDLWDPARGRVAAGTAVVGRVSPTATLLLDGRVLVAGGFNGPYAYGPGSTSAEIWNPATETFTPTGSMHAPHVNHTATLLRDGRVVIIGGESAEVWDPATGAFTPAGSLPSTPGVHTATLLPTGNVLILGREFAAVWDPVSRTMTSASASLVGDPTATTLVDGRVLVIRDGPALITSDGQTMTPVDSLVRRRMRYATALLPDGRVLVTGGVESEQGPPMAAVEVFDPEDGTFREVTPLARPVENHTALLLPDGRVLIVLDVNGPDGQAEPFTYDPGTTRAVE